MITSLPSFDWSSIGLGQKVSEIDEPSRGLNEQLIQFRAEDSDRGRLTASFSLPPSPQEKSRKRAATVPSRDAAERKGVTFCNDPEVDFVSIDESHRTSRAGSWGVAPFHDEYWDGETGKFREFPITETELRQANLRHEILTFLSQAVLQVKAILGIKSDGNANFKENKVEIVVEDEDKCADLDWLVKTAYNSMLRLIGPST